jgi:hypothetical protein
MTDDIYLSPELSSFLLLIFLYGEEEKFWKPEADQESHQYFWAFPPGVKENLSLYQEIKED